MYTLNATMVQVYRAFKMNKYAIIYDANTRYYSYYFTLVLWHLKLLAPGTKAFPDGILYRGLK